MYTMGAFFAVLAAYFLVKALHGQRQYYELQKNNIPRDPEMLATRRQFMCHYFWFVVSCSVMMYTHYYLLFAVAGLGLYGVWYHLRTYKDSFTKYGWIVLSGILMLILYVPWLKTFIFQFNQVGAGYWIPPMNRWSIPRTLWEILIKIAEPGAVTMILVSLLMLVALVQVIRKYSQPEKWLVIFSFIAPFAGAILFLILAKLRGGSSSVYLVRYFLFSSSFTIMVLALWFEVIRPTLVKKIVIGLFVVLNLFAIGYYWNQLNPAERPGMAAAAELLRTNVEPNHKLFVGSSFQFFNYKYYNQTPIQPLLYTNNHTVEDLPHYAGTAILTNNDLVLDFTKATKSGDTVWLLWTTGFGGTKPEVPANWTQVDEHGYAEIRPYVGTWVIVTQYKVK